MGLLPNLRDRRMALILEHESNPLYFKYLWAILLNASRQGTKITIFDCDWDKFEYSNENHDQMRKTNISKLRDEFLQALCGIANNAIEVVKISANEIQVEKNEIISVDNFSQADKIHYQFGNSLRSVFARNYLSTSNLTLKGARMRKHFRINVQAFLTMRLLCQNLFLSSQFDLILIANGRFPSQTAMRVAAEDIPIECYFYEHGMPKGESFHFAPFQTQEFLKMQHFIRLQITEKLENNRQAINTFAKQWLDNQANNISQNQFLTKSPKEIKWEKKSDNKPLAVIFNSSIDEKFSNMGVDLNGWGSQKQATSEVAGTLVQQGFQVVVRIHPNTANKSWWDLINLIYYLRAHEIDYILPWDGPSTYALLDEAKLVLTWGSTISMETVARSIPTVVFGRTMYDEIAGATIVDPYILRTIDFNNITNPNPMNGKIAAYFNKHWGYSLYDYCNPHDLKTIDIILNEYQNSLVPDVPSARKPYFVEKLQHKTNGAFVLVRRVRKGRYASPNDYRTLIGCFLPVQFSDYISNLALSIGLKIRPLTRDGEVSI